MHRKLKRQRAKKQVKEIKQRDNDTHHVLAISSFVKLKFTQMNLIKRNE